MLDSNIDSYQVQVFKDIDFGKSNVFFRVKIIESQIQIDGLKVFSTYYWKTRGYNASGFLVVGVRYGILLLTV